ncbi:aminotransferase [Microbacterium sp. VKM Ac-2870]|uniref:aminotransferase n=1 Tax=Microbacterium sp. VKM Ac-2870 TaxID=2783825 RepID=UPI00188D8C76|nr:aminotransferase [Microbacterium sp. VKM Ac-2870]MBF4561288.1 aminotransferase [Microbacterium sp. VKM Ac-2870]
MTDQTFDYFAQVELPTPTLSVAEVQSLFLSHFGVAVDAVSLGSQQDQNFRVFAQGSPDPLGVLKLSNPVFSEAEIDMQDAAAQTVADRQPSLRIPRVVVGANGPMSAWWSSSQGRIHARVIENMSGQTLMGSNYLAPAVVARMGELAGRVSTSLADFTHGATGRILQWDLRYAVRVIDLLLPLEPDADVRALVARATSDARRVLDPLAAQLPIQAGHFDVTDDNILRQCDSSLPDAVIDFGDVTASWAVAEIAVTVSSVLHHDGATPTSALPAIRAFHALRPLSDAEIDALWALVTLRGCVLVLSGRHQVRLDEQNTYADVALDREFRILAVAAAVPPEVMAATIRRDLALAPRPEPEWVGEPVLAPGLVTVELDAATTSALNDEGGWMDGEAIERAAHAALDAGADLVFLPAWRPILTGAPLRTPSAPATIPTAATIWLARCSTPLRARVRSAAPGILTVGSDLAAVVFTSAALGSDGDADAAFELPARTRITVRLASTAVEGVPDLVSTDLAAGWRDVVGDARAALGLPQPSPADDDVLARRERVLADVQEHYYVRPPQIERGWREYLIDVDGRVYLDMVNNVTSVGHAHPGVVAAATRQMRLLNTNSRFHYRAIADYAERLTATLPPELDTVFFVNSGSEATDLAIRLAMAATGRTDIVAMREAYHGWTFASDAVSTSIADNPNALATRPAWVHTVAAANSYRGEHRGADAARYAPEAVAVIDALADAGRPAAGFICEPFFGNAGGVALPEGYLEAVYAAVRAHGGLAIADEVQVGYGRLGEWFWGFQQQGVVPDIVAVAKSIGAGHPIGAVITRREIADRYRTQGYFFSSTGGSPVSSAIGMAVLDVIQNEGLQENARVVGAHLVARLNELAEEFPLIGQVHGAGLYLGVEFVRDPDTLEPATVETAAICARLRELGVIMQPTGDHQNVLKIKPPLCVSTESADYFADALGRVLRTGW